MRFVFGGQKIQRRKFSAQTYGIFLTRGGSLREGKRKRDNGRGKKKKAIHCMQGLMGF